MTAEGLAGTTHDETLLFFEAGEESLFGIFTRPTVEPLGVAVIVLPGGGGGTTNRNGISVRLCRRLAAEGYHALRFDYHGIGESTGVVEQFRVDEPFVEDLEGAVRWVKAQGIDKIVLFGNCFGARTALSYAPEVEGLEGVALGSPGPRDFAMGERTSTRLAIEWSLWDYIAKGLRPQTVRELFDPKRRAKMARIIRTKRKALSAKVRRRVGLAVEHDPRLVPVSPLFLEPLEALVQKRVPVLFIYGEEDDFFAEFKRAQSGRLGKILARGAGHVEIRTLPGEVHGFARTKAQGPVIDVVSEWLAERRATDADGSSLRRGAQKATAAAAEARAS